MAEKEKTVWELIFDALKAEKIDVYPPATHRGECLSKYVVVKRDGSSQKGKLSTEVVYYQFLLYEPRNRYSDLDRYEKEVKSAVKKLFPMLMPTGSTMPDYYDDSVKAHVRSFLYRNNVRNKYL